MSDHYMLDPKRLRELAEASDDTITLLAAELDIPLDGETVDFVRTVLQQCAAQVRVTMLRERADRIEEGQ